MGNNMILVSAKSRTSQVEEQNRQWGTVVTNPIVTTTRHAGNVTVGLSGTQTGLNATINDVLNRNADQRGAKLALALNNTYLPAEPQQANSNMETVIEEIQSLFEQFNVEVDDPYVSYQDRDIVIGFDSIDSMFEDNAQTAMQYVKQQLGLQLRKDIYVTSQRYRVWVRINNFGSAR